VTVYRDTLKPALSQQANNFPLLVCSHRSPRHNFRQTALAAETQVLVIQRTGLAAGRGRETCSGGTGWLVGHRQIHSMMVRKTGYFMFSINELQNA
jgi:hypothetical protein